MATIIENLQTIVDSTSAIKQAIIDKGGTIEGDISTWADAISAIQSGGSTSNEEITFVGTITFSSSGYLAHCTITGDLSSKPEDLLGGWLFMAFKITDSVVTGSISIDVSTSIKNISITCNFDEPIEPNTIPAIYIVYKSTDYSNENKIVPVKFEHA